MTAKSGRSDWRSFSMSHLKQKGSQYELTISNTFIIAL
nr:MAG TPA: hypothetical protein [Caudoviricetes sp.]